MNCPKCGLDMVKAGFRSTMLGKKQIFLCKTCRSKSTLEWPKMRFSKDDVLYAVGLSKSGASSGKIKKMLEDRNVKVSRWTIIKWFRKFG